MTAYQESFGDDFFDDEFWDEERRPKVIRDSISYNGLTREWECTCRKFQDNSACSHTYRFRKQDTIEVNKDYL